MSMFRSPLYLDVDIMVPLANYHGIEVMTDIAVSQRDRGERSGKASARVAVPIPSSPSFELGGSKGSETEVTQERTVKAHPTDALNRLLDELHRKEEVSSDLAGKGVARHQIVEIDRDWEVSPATDVGNLLTTMMAAFAENPAAMRSAEPPAALVASLMGTQAPRGPVVLQAVGADDQELRVLTLLSADCLVRTTTLDDIEEERTVFGQVDSVIAPGSQFSLEKFLFGGLSRSIRRAMPIDNMLSGISGMMGRPITAQDLVVQGPAVIIKAIAIY